jgi:hypothetical protein
MTTGTTTLNFAAAAPISRASGRVWTGRILSGLAVAFLAMDASMKLLGVKEAVEGTVTLGYPASVLFGLGAVQAICLALYSIPRTAVVGAVLWTGYLGGAIATHVRVESPLFTHTLFPIYVAALLWGGLWLRDPRVRGMLAPKH